METLRVNEDHVLEIVKTLTQPKSEEKAEKKKGKKNADSKLKDVVFKVIPCLFPLVIESILIAQGLNPDEKITLQKMELVMKSVDCSINFLMSFLNNKQKGYIFYKEKKVDKSGKESKETGQSTNTDYKK